MTRSTRWRDTARLGRALARTLFLTTLLAGAFGSFGVQGAAAGTDSWCGGCGVAKNMIAIGDAHSLTAARGTNNSTGLGCGGAVNYGSYYCADPAGCHTYSGSTVLTPAIRHPYNSTKPMSGYSTWGSTGPPASCNPGSPYSTGGPVEAAAATPQGVPVLDQREAVRAPAEVAELVPGADASDARKFSTPHGDGWVLVDAPGRQVCIALDDAGTGYGYSCQRLGRTQAGGALVSLEDANAKTGKGDVVVALAAEGVDALEIEQVDGTTRKVAMKDGIAVSTLTSTDKRVELPLADDAPEGVRAQRFAARR